MYQTPPLWLEPAQAEAVGLQRSKNRVVAQKMGRRQGSGIGLSNRAGSDSLGGGIGETRGVSPQHYQMWREVPCSVRCGASTGPELQPLLRAAHGRRKAAGGWTPQWWPVLPAATAASLPSLCRELSRAGSSPAPFPQPHSLLSLPFPEKPSDKRSAARCPPPPSLATSFFSLKYPVVVVS